MGCPAVAPFLPSSLARAGGTAAAVNVCGPDSDTVTDKEEGGREGAGHRSDRWRRTEKRSGAWPTDGFLKLTIDSS